MEHNIPMLQSFGIEDIVDDMIADSLPTVHIVIWSLLICISVVYFLLNIAFPSRAHVGPNPKQNTDHFTRAKLTTLARLCELTYSSSRVTENDGKQCIVPEGHFRRIEQTRGAVRVIVRGDSNNSISDYDVIQTYRNNSLWLLSPRSQAFVVQKWIIAIRGTHVLGDLLSNFNLTASVATGTDYHLNKTMKRFVKVVRDQIIAENRIGKEDHILLLGHSLGASIAETLYSYLRSSGFCNVSVVCYDSPGLPDFYRESLSNPNDTEYKDKMIFVYSHANVINNLCPAPTGVESYSVGAEELYGIQSAVSFFFNCPNRSPRSDGCCSRLVA